MKRFIILLSSLLFLLSGFAQQQQYSRVKIQANENELLLMARNGIDVTEGILKKGVFLITELSSNEITKIDNLGLNYEVLIADVAEDYVKRNLEKSTNISDYKGVSEWEVPENFDFGSMSGHCTFYEAVAHMDNMKTLFPDLITAKESIGLSIEGRDLWMVKISDNPEVNENEPEVLYTSLHHAREPAGLMTNLFYMYYLLENYDIDPIIQTLVDNTEMYFVLFVNPDGYVYNQTTNPNGGGMWRKNRRDNGDGSFGVDPNRNYGYLWGYDDIGSSPDPYQWNYRGAEAFSEPEIAAMRDLCETHEFKYALNYHTSGNMLLYVWGWTGEPCEDDATFFAHSSLMTADNNYTYGAINTTLYPANGGSSDWMYGEQTTKEKIFAYVPELGGSGDGFWCDLDRIVPIAQENMIQNLLAAAFSGMYADIYDVTPTLFGQTSDYLKFDLTRLGLVDGGTYTVTLDPISNVATVGDPTDYTDLAILETVTDSIIFSLSDGILSGNTFQFLLSVDNGEYIFSDTITKIFGEAIVLFEDDGNSMTNFSSAQWNVTTANFYSPTGSITDSPNGNYENYENSSVTLDESINLIEAAYAQLSFMATWEIEQSWDYVQLEISINNGGSWEALEGKYTVTGNSYQASGEPVYEGFNTDWVMEEIDLTQYIGNTVKFRFKLVSDGSGTEDGFYFDDFIVLVVEQATSGVNSNLQQSVIVSNPIPNPATNSVQFNFVNQQSNDLQFRIYNATGQEVYSTKIDPVDTSVIIPVQNWKPGMYYYKLVGQSFQTEFKKLIVL